MFDKLEDVPPPIRSFYHEVVGGDVITVEELPRYDLKSWDFVNEVRKMGNREFTAYCINKACESERWRFHDEYIKWYNNAPDEVDERYSIVNENGVSLYPLGDDASIWASQEPVDASTDPAEEVSRHNRELATNSRYDATYQALPITLSSGISTFVDTGAGKDGVLGIDNIKDAVMSHQAGHDASEVYWIMADNSVELVTVNDLQNMIVEFNKRKQFVFQQYGVWRQSNHLSPFKVS